MVLKEGSGGLKRLLRKARNAQKKHSKKDFLGSLFNKDSNAVHKKLALKRNDGERKEDNFHKFTAGRPLAKKSNLDRKFGGKAFTQKGKSEDRHKDNPEQKFKRQELVKFRLKSKKINEMKKSEWGQGGVGLSDPASGKGRLFIGSKSNVFRDKYRHPKKGRMRIDANLVGKKPSKTQIKFKNQDSKSRLLSRNTLQKSVDTYKRQKYSKGISPKKLRKEFEGSPEKRKKGTYQKGLKSELLSKRGGLNK